MVTEQHEINASPYPRLDQLATPQTVRAQVSVRDWRDAVEVAGGLLLNSGSIKLTYVAAMQRVLSELGPYAVLAPGIVLLHARPEDGVLSACIALVTLATPVPFGHSQNDPVDIVLAFGAVDKRSHMQALQQLAGLIGDASALAELRAARNDAGLLAVIQSWVASH